MKYFVCCVGEKIEWINVMHPTHGCKQSIFKVGSSFVLLFMSPQVELVEVLKNVDENIVKWFIHQSTSLVIMGNIIGLVLRMNNSRNVPLDGANNLVGIREGDVYMHKVS